ncbi:MAG TPA: hypothetical protein VH328_15320, partial [Burkholderiaceae bacterium]|nr:hypothetical protein [Burkholderiaceae bacterium]
MTPDQLTFVFTLLVGALVAAGMLCIFEGARRIAATGYERLGALLLVGGILVAVGKPAMDLYVASGL